MDVSILVRHKFKMNPLLVSYNKHYNTDVGVRNLANLRVTSNCDIITKTVNPSSVKRITRQTLSNLGSVYWHCLAGETVFPVQTAVMQKIPLIIWGAHQGVDQVGMFSHHDMVEMTRKYRKEHDLMGFEAEDLYGEMENLTEDHLSPFYYPEDYYIQRVGTRGIYLNNYIRWDSRKQHERMIELYSYETANVSRTFDKYNDVDSYIFADLHDLIKDLKHGYGKVVDHACRDIRLGHISRSQAINLVSHYGKQKPKFVQLFCNWLGIDDKALNYVLDGIRDPEIWYRDESWNWNRRAERVPSLEKSKFVATDFVQSEIYKSSDAKGRYILFGKGKRK